MAEKRRVESNTFEGTWQISFAKSGLREAGEERDRSNDVGTRINWVIFLSQGGGR